MLQSDATSAILPRRSLLLSQAAERAQTELTKRRASRTSLLAFTQYTFPNYRVGPHHRQIAAALEAVERGEIRRLMILCPPRHGKSELVSRRFPAWYLGRHPDRQFISASYGQSLADDFGRAVRNLIADKPFRAVFPDVSLAADSAAANRWHTNRAGAYIAVGVGGGVTGRGADVLNLDDVHKDREEADSALLRERVWNWFTSTAYTRLMPGGSIVCTLTRWHEDDIGGRLLAEMENGGDRWEVINLPAISEDGAALWPEAYDRAALDGIRAAIGERDFAALYMQRPAPAAGALFKVEQIGTLEASPAGGSAVRGWDLAATRAVGTKNPDWTCGVRLKRLPDGRFCVEDVVRLRGDPAEVEHAIKATAERDGRAVQIGLAQDPGAAGKAYLSHLVRQLTGFRVISSPESGDKSQRAAPLASQANVGNLTVVRGLWNRAYLDELAAFPSGAFDDQVDASSRAFGMLATPRGPAKRATIPFVGR